MSEQPIKPFVSKLSKSGNSMVITVPKFLIHAEIIDPKKEYVVTLVEKGSGITP